jgi:cytochrome bd-type quinol oxidase subunit 2
VTLTLSQAIDLALKQNRSLQLARLAARTEPERVQALRAIGPVWDGNEVWLLATGGTLFFAFPLLYASAFSGF